METLPSGVRVYKCTRWEDFISEVRSFHINADMDSRRIFRGHAHPSWKLASVWERIEQRYREKNGDVDIDISERKKYRDQYLEYFKQISVGIPNFQSKSLTTDNDWWALGRHHGLKTPLLDWTYSPYVAAYFAAYGYLEMTNQGLFSGTSERFTIGNTTLDSDGKITPDMINISIWGLVLSNEVQQLEELSLIENRIDDAYRQKAQQGVFTSLEHDKHLDIETFLVSKQLGRYLERYDIPLSETGKIIKDLSLMNITPSSLFPDLVGAAMHANIVPILGIAGIFAKHQEEIFSKR